MSNLVFAWPFFALGMLLLLPMWFIGRRHMSSASLIRSPMALSVLAIKQGGKKRISAKGIPWGMILSWSLLTLALMRPQHVGVAQEIPRDARSIMLVIDISESMEALDMKLNNKPADRLTIAKDVMSKFIDQRPGDRIGLVVFGSESFLHAPLSFDHQIIKKFLMDAQIGFAGPRTAIGDAIGLAVKKLLAQTQGERMMILITDGQNNEGALEPMQAAQIASNHNVKVYIIGLGASRMVVDGFFGPTAINPSKSLEQAEPELSRIAQVTGGKYFRAKDHKALAAIYSDIDKLEPISEKPLLIIPTKELFYWPLILLLLLMLLKVLLRVIKVNLIAGKVLPLASSRAEVAR